MSHNTSTTLPGMKDQGALVAAAKRLGCTVIKDGTALMFGSNTAKGEVVLTHPASRYDVAMNKNKADDLYEATTDFWGGDVEKVYGKNFGKLTALYGAEIAKRVARLHGWHVKETVDQETGTITQRVVIT